MDLEKTLIYSMSGGTAPSMYFTAEPLGLVNASAGNDQLPPHHAPNEYITVEEFIANGYYGDHLSEDLGTGVSNKERELMDLLSSRMDKEINLTTRMDQAT